MRLFLFLLNDMKGTEGEDRRKEAGNLESSRAWYSKLHMTRMQHKMLRHVHISYAMRLSCSCVQRPDDMKR